MCIGTVFERLKAKIDMAFECSDIPGPSAFPAVKKLDSSDEEYRDGIDWVSQKKMKLKEKG